MKKIILLLLIILGTLVFPKKATAIQEDDIVENCTWTVKDTNNQGPPFQKFQGKPIPIRITVGNFQEGDQFKIYVNNSALKYSETADANGKVNSGVTVNFSQTNQDIVLNLDRVGSVQNPICSYTISPEDWTQEPTPTPGLRADCKLTLTQGTNLTLRAGIYNVKGMTDYNVTCRAGTATLCSGSVTGGKGSISKTFRSTDFTVDNNPGPKSQKSAILNMGSNYPDGNYNVKVSVSIISTTYPIQTLKINCSTNFNIPFGILTPYPTSNPLTPIPYPSLAPLCDQLPGEFQVNCKDCVEGQHKIWTAIGCIAPDLGSFISEQLLGVGVGIAGGIAFLYFLYGAFLFLTSRGNPEQIAMGREIIMSSLLGLALIIFSVFLLRVISVDILKIPGFG